jgi:membrane protease YdiL (CAAX protease family)
MTTQEVEQRKTFRILLILIGVRFLYGFVLLTGNDSLWWESVYSFLTYSLITIVIFLNESSLHLFHIDRVSMALFVFLGGLYSFFIPQPIGAMMTMVALFNLNMLLSKELSFSRIQFGVSVFALIILFIVLQLIYFLWIGETFSSVTHDVKVVSVLFKANFTWAIFEEIIFRGILWRYLKNKGLKEYQVVFTQAFFFWLVHFYYYPHLIFFWIFVPVASVLFGVITYKSRSLLPSFIVHYFFNFVSTLLSVS